MTKTKQKYLTKSKFKMAFECPTKLYYYDRKDEYANSKLEDPFLKALAKGGFQVGELAKCYHPGGVDIKSLNYDEALEQTNKLLKQDEVTIFEAAVKFENLFIRVDILEKKGNILNLIEVKAKSVDPATFEDELWVQRDLKKGVHSLKKDWKDYLYDVAFQSYVLKKALPEYQINNYLMCANKKMKATVTGLNQKFAITELNGRTSVEVRGDISKEALGEEVLYRIPVNEVVSIIHEEKEMSQRFNGLGFEGAIKKYSEQYAAGIKISSDVGTKCKGCEFRTKEEGKKSGFNECWKLAHGMTEEELNKPFVFDVWNFKGANKILDDGRHLMEEINQEDIKVNKKDEPGLVSGERQLLQVEKEIEQDLSSFIDLDGLADEMSQWKFPLNMIDFETSTVAIPFTKDRRPYEQIAFQFSHHIIYKDGRIEHANEFLLAMPGEFPNFYFVDALKTALKKNDGTIFRYSHHENTVLCQIIDQLEASDEEDKDELIAFIKTITAKKAPKCSREKMLWVGERNMVDLCEMVKKYYYSPLTKGSNSIKYVLPAILNESDFLKNKYSKPIYGKDIKSFGFKEHAWLKFNKDGSVINPYESLPKILDEWDYDELERVMSDDDIQNGGAALTAYAMLQFTHMSEKERWAIEMALLRYCELDTFAMVMIWEFWNSLTNENKEKDVA